MQGQNTSTRAGALFVDTVTDPENYFFIFYTLTAVCLRNSLTPIQGSGSQQFPKVQQCFLLRWGGLQVTKPSWEAQILPDIIFSSGSKCIDR